MTVEWDKIVNASNIPSTRSLLNESFIEGFDTCLEVLKASGIYAEADPESPKWQMAPWGKNGWLVFIEDCA